MQEVTYRGLIIEGLAEYEPATDPTYACGGTPSSWDVDVRGVYLEDTQAFEPYLWEILDHMSEGAIAMVAACQHATGVLVPMVRDIILNLWQEEIENALVEESSCW